MKIFGFLLCLFALCLSKQTYENHKVVSVEINSEAQKHLIETLFNDNIDVWSNEGVLVVGNNDVLVSPVEFEMIQKIFPKYNIKISNLQSLINEEEAVANSIKPFTVDTPTEEFFKKYHRLAEITTFLEKMKKDYPDQVKLFSIGKSYEGRDMKGIKISQPKSKEKKKKIWMSSHQHAREWVSSMVPLYIMSRLLAEYKKGTKRVVDIFKKTNFYFVTNLNPDGYEYSHTNSRMWRKNRKKNEDGRTFGVDLNRNWPYKWGGPGGSRSPGSDTYMGTKPASEIETQNVIKFFNKTKIDGALDFHSYSQLLLRPWQWTRDSSPDEPALMALGAKMAKAIQDNGDSYRNIRGSQLYVHSGAMVDFFYGDKKIFGYTVELRDRGRYGFALPPSLILPTCIENYFGSLEFIEHFTK
eukprot:gene6273-10280_t